MKSYREMFESDNQKGVLQERSKDDSLVKIIIKRFSEMNPDAIVKAGFNMKLISGKEFVKGEIQEK